MKTLAERREYQRRYWETHSRKLHAKVFPCPWKHSDGCTFESTDPAKHHEHCHEHELLEMKGRPEFDSLEGSLRTRCAERYATEGGRVGGISTPATGVALQDRARKSNKQATFERAKRLDTAAGK